MIVEKRQPETAAGILTAGAFIHLLMCQPAATCRGYPPLDPLWYGVTYIWPLFVLASAYFDSLRYTSRRQQLAVYSFVTAFVSAATLVTIFPRRPDAATLLFHTGWLFVIHLAITLLFETAIQLTYWRIRRLVNPVKHDGKQLRMSRRAIVFTAFWICLIPVPPVVYRAWTLDLMRSRGIEAATSEWPANVGIYSDYEYTFMENGTIVWKVDRQVGLVVRPHRGTSVFRGSYNNQVRLLIDEHGLPVCSMLDRLPTSTRIAEIFNSPDLSEVTEFPFQVTPAIKLELDKAFRITTNDGSYTIDYGNLPAHIAQEGGLVYIRIGMVSMDVFTDDGLKIASVSGVR